MRGYHLLTKGVSFGFTIEQAVNAMVTGSFPFIGLLTEVLDATAGFALPSIKRDGTPQRGCVSVQWPQPLIQWRVHYP